MTKEKEKYSEYMKGREDALTELVAEIEKTDSDELAMYSLCYVREVAEELKTEAITELGYQIRGICRELHLDYNETIQILKEQVNQMN